MNAGNLDITMTADEREVIKAQAKVIKQQDQMIEKYRKTFAESKRSTKAATKELERFAQKTNQINMTPAQRYRQEMDRLNLALKKGLISQETYNRAVRRAGQQHAAAFSTKNVTAFSGAMLATLGTITAVAAKLTDVSQQFDRLKSAHTEGAGGIAQLAQVATDQQDFRLLTRQARSLYAQGAASSLSDAGQFMFQIRSAGLDSDMDTFARIRSSGLAEDASGLVKAVDVFTRNFGKGETGDASAIVSKLLGASSLTQQSAEAIGAASARGAQFATALGLTDEEMLAAMSQASGLTGSAEQGGTVVAALLKSIEKSELFQEGDLKGKSLREMVQAIQGQVDAGEDLFDILGGRAEAIQGFRIIANDMRAYDKTLRVIKDSERNKELETKLRFAEQDPILAAERAARIAKAKEELSGQKTAQKALEQDAAASDFVRAVRDVTGSEVLASGAEKAAPFIGGRFGNIKELGLGLPLAAGRILTNAGTESDQLRNATTLLERAAGKLDEAASKTVQKSNINAMRQNQQRHGGGVEAQ